MGLDLWHSSFILLQLQIHGALIFELGVRINAILLVLENSNSPMVPDPVLGVAAELVDFWIVVAVDSGTAMATQFLDLLELLGTHEDLLLGHLDERAIKVLEEESVFLKHLFLNFHDLNEVDKTFDSKFVSDHSTLRHNHVVDFLGASDNPLEVLDGNFVVHRHEEGFESARKTPVEVQNSSIHVHFDHVTVPEVAREDRQRHDHKE